MIDQYGNEAIENIEGKLARYIGKVTEIITSKCRALYKVSNKACKKKYGGGSFGRRRLVARQLGAVPFGFRTFRRRFPIFIYFSSYEKKIMKQAIP